MEVSQERELSVLLLTSAGLRDAIEEFFRVPMGVSRVFNSLFREFVSGEMISFSVSGRSSAVSVRRKIVKLCGSIVSALGHIVPPGQFDAVTGAVAL
jgi:hypothetical protein